MTMATNVEAVVGVGRPPLEPAMSMWLYFRGFSDDSMCLSRPET